MTTEAVKPRIGERRPGVIAAIVLLVFAGMFSALGQWQLQRGREQRALEEEVNVNGQLPPIDLAADGAYRRDAYRRAVVEGIFDGSQQFYLEGRRYQDRIGYHVVTPLRITGTRRYVLVNRGWISERAITAEVPAGRVRVSGVLIPAQMPRLRLGEPAGATRPYLDPQDYARETGRVVEPLMLVAEEKSRGLSQVKFEPVSKRGMHEGYAMQWFAYALIAFFVALGLVIKRLRYGRS